MISGTVFEEIWRGVAVHLWQTTLVLVALLLIARTMRNAPARLLNALWWIGFAKIFMPLALLGHAGRMLARTLADPAGYSISYHTVVVALTGGASYIMEPGLLVVGARTGESGPANALFVGLTLAWGAGAVYMLARWIQKARRNHLRGVSQIGLRGDDIGQRIENAACSVGIEPGAVLISEGEGVPAVSGLLRPRIIVPGQTAVELSEEELRAVLLHENAHRRRYEPLRLSLQRLALTVFFFYPPLWLLLRELNSSAEMACDEAVLEAGTGMETYAAAIARMLGFWTAEGLAVSMLGFGSLTPIRARLSRLEKKGRYITMTRHRLAILAAVLVVVILSFIPLAPLADSPPAPPAVPAAPEAPEEVETPPELLPESIAYPEYPQEARKAGIEGEVLLEVAVGKDGAVKDVKVRQGIPGHPELAENAVKAVKNWTFKPGLRNGVPFETEVLIPLAFSLDDSKPKDVGVPPAIIDDLCPLPEYPEAARKAGVEGKVLVEVLISADGGVTGAVVKEGIAGHPELDRAAVDAVMQWKFEPATSNGEPVEMSILIPIEFRLDSKKAKD